MKRIGPILLAQEEAGALIGKIKLLLEEVMLEDFPGNDQDQKVEEPPKPEQQDSAMEAEAKVLGGISWKL